MITLAGLGNTTQVKLQPFSNHSLEAPNIHRIDLQWWLRTD